VRLHQTGALTPQIQTCGKHTGEHHDFSTRVWPSARHNGEVTHSSVPGGATA